MKKIIGKALTAVYRWGLLSSQASYRSIPGRIHRVNARVISVGDITWGGTGKTPLVTKLARDLIDYGKKVAILTCGDGKDEVEELRRRLPDVPILVGRDRVKKAREAVEKYKAEVLLLDDGFQHIRLHRDLDVVTISATLPLPHRVGVEKSSSPEFQSFGFLVNFAFLVLQIATPPRSASRRTLRTSAARSGQNE